MATHEIIREPDRKSTSERHPGRIRFAVATDEDRHAIYRIRHEIYAVELKQHAANAAGALRDGLDEHNVYIVATSGDEIAGFVSITPPEAPSFSLDKYVPRDRLPFACDDRTYEVRLLTVREPYRGMPLAPLLLYAAYRWIEDRGGDLIFGIGREEIKQIYAKLGARPTGIEMQSGAVTYELMAARAVEYRRHLGRYDRFFRRLESRVDWQLEVPYRRPEPCFHGGAFFAAIGEGFDDLERRHDVVNADVLDAWFAPSPKVTDTIRDHLEWLTRTSPPTYCEGMVAAIAEARGVPAACILPGAGSSDLIFRAFREWLSPASRALILDPSYGEYAHALAHVAACKVDRLPLSRGGGYRVDPDVVSSRLAGSEPYDLLVLVNPNSPTGAFMDGAALEALLERVPLRTRVWIDETYIEYAGSEHSMEGRAARSENVFVCKSMSKVYALSGLRVAYLCGPPAQLARLRLVSPPWTVSLPGQVAAVKALQDPDYYQDCYARAHAYRDEMSDWLAAIPGVEVTPSTANFLLLQLPNDGPDAATVVDRCRRRGVFLRDAGGMGTALGSHALRTAVKQREVNKRIVKEIAEAIAADSHPTSPDGDSVANEG